MAHEQTSNNWTIELATPDDATTILKLQRLAYQSEASLYIKAVAGDRIVGSVRGHLNGESCYIGRLMVHPDVQNRGIGTALMSHIEREFPAARRF